MMGIYDKIRYYGKLVERKIGADKACRGYDVKLRNWFEIRDEDLWLPRFVKARGITDGRQGMRIGLFTVAGPKWVIRKSRFDRKIFLCRENVHRPSMKEWEGMMLDEPEVQLTIGYDHLDHPGYIRVPLWVMWVFSPTDNLRSIRLKIEAMENPSNSSFEGRRFCSFLSSHDDTGRGEIYRSVSSVGRVDCDGRLFHNNDDLRILFGDNKQEYLRRYRFNLTPENSNHEGYCTEKLFEAIRSGCVPIYRGSLNNPEPDVLNHDAILMYDGEESHAALADRLRELNGDEKKYLRFARQPRFTPEAPEVIASYMERLEEKIRSIL